MTPVELRPLSLGELLDRTFTLYRTHFWLFAGIMAVPASFSVPLNVFFFSLQSASLILVANRVPSAAPSADTVALITLSASLLLLAYALAVGAATFAVSESYLGHASTVRGSYGKVGGNFWKIVGVTLNIALRTYGLLLLAFVGVAILIAGAAFLIQGNPPGRAGSAVVAVIIGVLAFLAILAGLVFTFVFVLRYAVAIPALLLEDLGVFAAIRRSIGLTRGRRWQIFLAMMLTVVIGYVGVIVFQGPFFIAMFLSARGGHIPGWLALASAAAAAVGGTLTGPLLMIVLVLCYYDSRIRKEAFDLQFMMSSLEPPASPGAVTPA